MKYLKIAGALCVVLGLANCTSKEVREPAATTKPVVITSSEEKILGEMIGNDSPTRLYRHPMQIKFYTNNDKKYLTETARKALQEALFKSFASETGEQGLGKVVAGNLKDAFLDNFIKTLRLYKIVNTSLQVDLAFAPVRNYANDFNPELSSNQMVNLDDVGSLSAKWDRLERSTFTETVYNNSTLIPDVGRSASYIGGVATIYIEILDSNPTLKIPMPLKNGVKGFIRYRRYYRVPQDLSGEIVCGNFTMKANKSKDGVPLFYTVDLYKNFNLKSLIPTEESIEIYPGLIATTNVGRKELLPTETTKIGRSIPVADLVINQTKGLGGTVSFSLEKLVYKASDRSLNVSDSEAKYVDGKGLGKIGGPLLGVVDQAKAAFLKQCETPLAKLLNLDLVLPGGSL